MASIDPRILEFILRGRPGVNTAAKGDMLPPQGMPAPQPAYAPPQAAAPMPPAAPAPAPAPRPMPTYGPVDNGQDAEDLDPTYGVPRDMVKRARSNMLMNLGATLLAAGSPQSPDSRSRVLAGLGSAASGMTTDIYNAAQAKLMNAQARAKTQGGYRLLSAEEVASVPGLNPQGAYQIDTENKITPVSGGGGDDGSDVFKTILYKSVGTDTQGQPILQAFMPTTAGGIVPIGQPGEVMGPEQIAAMKASGAAEGTAAGKSTAEAPEAITGLQQGRQTIASILEDKDLDAVVGPVVGNLSGMSLYAVTRNPRATSVVAKIDKLQAQSFTNAVSLMTNLGALSNTEGAKLDTVQENLTRARTPEDFRVALKAYDELLARGEARQKLIMSGKSKAEAQLLVPEYEGPVDAGAPAPAPSAQGAPAATLPTPTFNLKTGKID